jgi:hypothetical protein
MVVRERLETGDMAGLDRKDRDAGIFEHLHEIVANPQLSQGFL